MAAHRKPWKGRSSSNKSDNKKPDPREVGLLLTVFLKVIDWLQDLMA